MPTAAVSNLSMFLVSAYHSITQEKSNVNES